MLAHKASFLEVCLNEGQNVIWASHVDIVSKVQSLTMPPWKLLMSNQKAFPFIMYN